MELNPGTTSIVEIFASRVLGAGIGLDRREGRGMLITAVEPFDFSNNVYILG